MKHTTPMEIIKQETTRDFAHFVKTGVIQTQMTSTIFHHAHKILSIRMVLTA
ncbi:hypothetical protein GF327_04675 [Candidatus Woesearchaeota archaeon]|nr:hypothetical protein [Candidatus Woesearchaeota archaeon]